MTAYVAAGQDSNPSSFISFELRGSVPLSELAAPVRAAILSVHPDISLDVRDFENQVNESLLQPRAVALLSSLFGLLALLMAAIGLYGVTAYGVSQRKNEIGIRLALGARRTAVVWLVLRDVVTMIAIGTAAGLAGSLAFVRVLKSLLYGVQLNDPAQLAGAALVLMICTLLSAYAPAWRAARLDPMQALREE